MGFVFLVRHGQGTLDGGPYDQLSETGKSQADFLGKALVNRTFEIDVAFSGTLNRHQQTAQIVIENYDKAGMSFPEVLIDERFNEIDSLKILTKISARRCSPIRLFTRQNCNKYKFLYSTAIRLWY